MTVTIFEVLWICFSYYSNNAYFCLFFATASIESVSYPREFGRLFDFNSLKYVLLQTNRQTDVLIYALTFIANIIQKLRRRLSYEGLFSLLNFYCFDIGWWNHRLTLAYRTLLMVTINKTDIIYRMAHQRSKFNAIIKERI